MEITKRKQTLLNELFWIRIGLLPLLAMEKQQDYYNYLFDIHFNYGKSEDSQHNYEVAKKEVERIKVDLAGLGIDVEKEAKFAEIENTKDLAPWE